RWLSVLENSCKSPSCLCESSLGGRNSRGDEHQIHLERPPFPVDSRRSTRIVGNMSDELLDQGWFHGEYGVGVKVRRRTIEDMRGETLESRGAYRDMDVSRPPRMPAGCGEHMPDRAVVRNRIWRRSDREKGKAAVVTSDEPTSKMLLWRFGVLNRIETIGTVLPNVDLRSR